MYKQITLFIVASVFSFQTLAVGNFKYTQDENISGLNKIIGILEDNTPELNNEAQQIKQYYELIPTFSSLHVSKQGLEDTVKSRLKYISRAQDKLENQIGYFYNVNKKNAKLINQLSERAYHETDMNKLAELQTLIYYSLVAQRQSYRNIVNALVPLAIVSGDESLNDTKDNNVITFRKKVLHQYLTALSMQKIIELDIQKTVVTLNDLKENQSLSNEMIDILNDSISDLVQKDSQERTHLRSEIKSDKLQMPKQIEEYMKNLKGKSLLYSPEQDASALANLISWVGNLTWGLVNTIVGAAVVAFAMIAVPIITLGQEFVHFSISASGSQIYVYTPGLGLMPGKLSMGLFELDNTGMYTWASEHEGVHALQSALLGPLYLPAILVSYAIFGFDQGPLEDLAWNLAGI